MIQALNVRLITTVMLINILIPDIYNEDIVPSEAHCIAYLRYKTLVPNPFLQATFGILAERRCPYYQIAPIDIHTQNIAHHLSNNHTLVI